MQNEIKVLNKAERMNGVKALESAGFPALRSGLGVPMEIPVKLTT